MTDISRHAPGTPCWFDLATSDPEAARAFYGALFGWTFEVGGPEYGGYSTALLRGRKAAGVGPLPPGQPVPPTWNTHFATPDADATATAITHQGGNLLFPAMEIAPHGVMVVALDPDGASFGAWQPIKHMGFEVSGEPGAWAWCEVHTRDAEGACRFYGAVFGLTAKKLEGGGAMTYYTLAVGETANACCGVLQMSEPSAGVPPHWTVYFVVANADAAVAKIGELGGQVASPPVDTPYGRMASVSDPQGARFAIIQLPEGMGQPRA